MQLRFDRLLVCLPSSGSVEPLLFEAARFAARLPPSTIEIVAAAAHRLHDERSRAVRDAFKGAVETIHLVPSPRETSALAASIADRHTLIVTAEQRRRHKTSASLVLRNPVEGRAVVAVVDPQRDTIAGVRAAIELAQQLAAPRVVACHVYFDEASIASDAWEERRHDERAEQMDIFLARVPSAEGVTITPCVVQSPYPARALTRVAGEAGAAIAVGQCDDLAGLSLLSLPEAVARRAPATPRLRALWDAFIAGAPVHPA
jgi:hypothetical protein